MKERVARVNKYFDRQITECEQQEKRLREDGRADEATFEKIKANVYDIFRTILSVAVKTGKGDPAATKRFFVAKTEQIPANWAASYEQAQKHEDVVKMQIERIKLDTVREIRQHFAQEWEEEA